MAATNKSPGDLLLMIGQTGKTLISSFTKFITYRKVHDRRLENLYATLSLTASVLVELGASINKYHNDFHVKEEVYRPVCETAKSNFELLLRMVQEGNATGVWKNDGTIGGQAVSAETDPWFLITMALGGREEAKLYWKSLDDTRDTLIELNDLVKYQILKNLNIKTTLTAEQTEELKELNSLLPHLCHSLEKAEKGKKMEAEAAAKKAESDLRSKEKEEDYQTTKRPSFARRDSNASSNVTLIVERTKGPNVKDIDCESISSFNSSDSGSFLETHEIYEEWLLKWFEPARTVKNSWGFPGLKFRSYYEDTGFWESTAEYRTQGEMKEQHQFAAADLSTTKHKEAMQKALQAIPKKCGYEIDNLLEQRTAASSDERAKRQWTVVAVRPQQKHPYGSAKKWGKDPLYTNWLVTIKGETCDTVERSRNYKRDDPWRKRDYSPIRSRSPRRRYPPIRNRNYSRSPMRHMPIARPMPFHSGPPRPPPPPPLVRREATTDEGFRQGVLVVGKILSKDDAVKKIDEIWAEMTTQDTVETAEIKLE